MQRATSGRLRFQPLNGHTVPHGPRLLAATTHLSQQVEPAHDPRPKWALLAAQHAGPVGWWEAASSASPPCELFLPPASLLAWLVNHPQGRQFTGQRSCAGQQAAPDLATSQSLPVVHATSGGQRGANLGHAAQRNKGEGGWGRCKGGRKCRSAASAAAGCVQAHMRHTTHCLTNPLQSMGLVSYLSAIVRVMHTMSTQPLRTKRGNRETVRQVGWHEAQRHQSARRPAAGLRRKTGRKRTSWPSRVRRK